jgi:hypothetical protein
MQQPPKDLLIWKGLALAGVLVYLYKVTKANGGTLTGNSMGVNINPEKVIGLASQFVPEHQRRNARVIGEKIWTEFNRRSRG